MSSRTRKRRQTPKTAFEPQTGAERLKAHRARMRARGFVRHELWVPKGMTREEKAVLQDWVEDILIDIRAAPVIAEEETGNV